MEFAKKVLHVDPSSYEHESWSNEKIGELGFLDVLL